MGQLASALSAEQLELPLAFEPQCALLSAQASSPGAETRADWSAEAELALHGVVLERNLKVLSYRGNAEEKRDVLHWIFKPDVTHFTVDGRRLSQHQNDVPFSFQRCCRLAGYDADELRDALRALLRRRGMELPGARVPGIEPC